jgi:hypothetical protein
MITGSDAGDWLVWSFFWLALALALYWGFGDIAPQMERWAGGGNGIRDFPRELQGDVGPEKSAAREPQHPPHAATPLPPQRSPPPSAA